MKLDTYGIVNDPVTREPVMEMSPSGKLEGVTIAALLIRVANASGITLKEKEQMADLVERLSQAKAEAKRHVDLMPIEADMLKQTLEKISAVPPPNAWPATYIAAISKRLTSAELAGLMPQANISPSLLPPTVTSMSRT